jgi:hypothetical protein
MGNLKLFIISKKTLLLVAALCVAPGAALAENKFSNQGKERIHRGFSDNSSSYYYSRPRYGRYYGGIRRRNTWSLSEYFNIPPLTDMIEEREYYRNGGGVIIIFNN